MKRGSGRSFLSGVSVLTLSALCVKVLGLFYRIPLLGVLGTEGMGYFNTAFEVYALLCVLSTAGLPVAMSVLLSSAEAEGRGEDARRIFRVSLAIFAVIGILGTVVLTLLAKPVAGLFGNPGAEAALRVIAPTVMLICLSAALRGRFQGRCNMVPTAVSHIVEAAGKLLLGLAFALLARTRGADLPMTAAAAVGGLTVGTALSLVYLYVHTRVDARRESLCAMTDGSNSAGTAPMRSTRRILGALAATAVPVTLSAGLISLSKCVDIAIILRRLQAVGYTAAEANALYGCYSTLAVPLFNMLPAMASSITMPAVPALAASLGRGSAGVASAGHTAKTSMGLTLLLALPAALGLSVYAGDVLALLFAGQPAAVAEATPWLSCLGLTVPAACLVTVTGAFLQAAGRADLPVRAMLLGVGLKTAVLALLVGQDGWGMAAAPVSALLCDTVIVAVNLLSLRKYAPTLLPSTREGMALLAPLASAALAVVVVQALRGRLGWSEATPLHTLATIAAVTCLYAVGLALLRLGGMIWSTYRRGDARSSPSAVHREEKEGIRHEQTDENRA